MLAGRAGRSLRTVLVPFLAPLLAAVAVLSCGGSGGFSSSGGVAAPQQGLKPTPLPQAQADPQLGGTSNPRFFEQAVIGPAGGTLSALVSGGPVTLVVPPGALSSDRTITVGPAGRPVLPSGAVAIGPAVQFGPDGLVFATPVTVTLAYTPPTSGSVVVYNVSSIGLNELLVPISKSGGTVTVQASHFSVFVPAAVSLSPGIWDQSLWDAAAWQ